MSDESEKFPFGCIFPLWFMNLINMISGRVGWARVERLRAYYSEQAQRLVTDAKSHLDMGRTYEKQALTFEAKHPYGTLGVSHCKYWLTWI